MLLCGTVDEYSGYDDAPMSEAGDDGAEVDVVRRCMLQNGCFLTNFAEFWLHMSLAMHYQLPQLVANFMQADGDYDQEAQDQESAEEEEDDAGGLSDEEISD